jgi:hypothetical protein
MISGCTEIVNENDNTKTGTWLDDYVPVHDVGIGDNNFWIEFPSSSDSNGLSINHLSWINNSLDENCVLFVVHKTGCVGCAAQADRVIYFSEKYENQVEFWDLDIPLGGDIEEKAYESYLYDPDGSPGYIALTGIFTYVEHNGITKIGWHSWEGNVADSNIEEWVKDAIYYYHVNSGEK